MKQVTANAQNDRVFIKVGREAYPRLRPCVLNIVQHESGSANRGSADVMTASQYSWTDTKNRTWAPLSLDRHPVMGVHRTADLELLLISCLVLRRKRLPKRLRAEKTDRFDRWFHPVTKCPIYQSEITGRFYVYLNRLGLNSPVRTVRINTECAIGGLTSERTLSS
jgi:hypothetical protein